MIRSRMDPRREHRITMEIVVDTYTEEECAMGWHCYLGDRLSFPFKARVRQAMDASPLKTGDTVTVIALAHDQLCRIAIFVVADWHYWHDYGYTF